MTGGNSCGARVVLVGRTEAAAGQLGRSVVDAQGRFTPDEDVWRKD